MTDENRTFLLFPDDGDDLTEWDEASDLTIQNEQLEEILSEERALELERELEQDENPRDYTVELEDEEEEAAPVSEKRLSARYGQRRWHGWRMLQEQRTTFDTLSANGTGWIGIGNDGSVTMKISGEMFR